MKTLAVPLFMSLAVVSSSGQTKHEWDKVTKQVAPVCDKLKALVEEIRKSNPAFKEASVECGISVPMIGGKTTERRIQLTPAEIDALEYKQAKSTVAFYEQAELEKRIIAAHGVKVPSYGDPCWHYVGIKLNDHFITEDVIDPTWASTHCGGGR